MTTEKKYRYSEIFSSFQGEGKYTGTPSVWLRFWGCNLECKGFGQENIDDESTWKLPYKDFDTSSIIAMEDLPVWNYGCDSSYSWSKKFKHLAHVHTVSEIVDKLTDKLRSPSNPDGKFLHPVTNQETHLVFTGGEPMMSQGAMVRIVEEFLNRENPPRFITVETNGTQEIKEELADFIHKFHITSDYGGVFPNDRGNPEWFWSVSPKLRASGEKWDVAIKPEVVEGYSNANDSGQLKFVVDGSERTWFEVEKARKEFVEKEVGWETWIMPVGATKESQETSQTADIVTTAIGKGYKIAARVHCLVFGNKLGT